MQQIALRETIYEVAHTIFQEFLEEHKDELGGRNGAQFIAVQKTDALLRAETFSAFVHAEPTQLLGVLAGEKITEKKTFAANKVIYLGLELQKERTTRSSYFGWNTAAKIFGGGIVTFNYLLATSGLPPHLDQKFCIRVASHPSIQELDEDTAYSIDMETKTLQNKYKAL